MAVAGFNMAAALDMAGFRLRPLLRRWQAVWSREHRAHIYVRFYFCEASNTWRMDNGTPQSPTWARPGGIVFVAVDGEDDRWVDARPNVGLGSDILSIVCDRCRARHLLQLRACRVCRPMPLTHSLPDLRRMALLDARWHLGPPNFADSDHQSDGTTIAGADDDDDEDLDEI